MSNTLTKTRAKKYLQKMHHLKRSYISFDILSENVGIFKDVIQDDFAMFDPMVRLDDQVNLMDYENDLIEFIDSAPTKKRVKLEKYETVSEFIYKNCTTSGGLVDVNFKLSYNKLKELRKVVNKEIKEFK